MTVIKIQITSANYHAFAVIKIMFSDANILSHRWGNFISHGTSNIKINSQVGITITWAKNTSIPNDVAPDAELPTKVLIQNKVSISIFLNFCHQKLQFWRLPMQQVMEISSSWQHARCSVILGYLLWSQRLIYFLFCNCLTVSNMVISLVAL